MDDESCKAMNPVVTACKDKAEKLDKLFQKVLPHDTASRLDRYFSAAKTLGKGGRVETLMKGILEDIHLLASNHAMGAATTNQVDEIAKAIRDVSGIESSIPESVLHDIAFTNNNFGSGPMTNHNVQGNQYSQTNNSTGQQFQAEHQTITIGKSS